MNFQIAVDEPKIMLSGDMAASSACRSEIERVFRRLRPGTYRVEARVVTLDPAAVDMWINAVNRVSERISLRYAPSQLAMVLEYDDRYTHAASSFEDSYESDAEPEMEERALFVG